MDKPVIPRAEQVGSLKRSPRLIAANEAVYAPGHVAIEASERAHGLDELYAIAAEETRQGRPFQVHPRPRPAATVSASGGKCATPTALSPSISIPISTP